MNPFAVKLIRIVVAAVMIVPAVYLLAFGPRETDTLPRGRIIVDYWEKWTGREAVAMQKIVDDFNDTVGKDKGIFVRYLSTSGVDQKTLIATAGGVPPDIAGLWDQNLVQFGARGALEPLDALATAHRITSATYKNVFWDDVHFDGKLYGLVVSAYDVGMYYNTDMVAAAAPTLRAAGLDPNRPPQTLAEFHTFAMAMQQIDANGHIRVAGYLPTEPAWYSQFNCFWFGASWWDAKNQKFTLTDLGVVSAYRWVQSFYPTDKRQAVVQFQSGVGNFDSPSNAFFANTVAMEQQGTFFASFIHNQKPAMDGHWAAAAFPSADPHLKDVTYCNADVLCIPRGAKHKAEAFEFMTFAVAQKQHEYLARAHGKISALTDVSPAFWVGHPNPYIHLFDRLARSPNAQPTPPCPIYSEAIDELDHVIQQVTVLGEDPAVALAAAQQTLQTKYDAFALRQAQRKAAENELAN